MPLRLSRRCREKSPLPVGVVFVQCAAQLVVRCRRERSSAAAPAVRGCTLDDVSGTGCFKKANRPISIRIGAERGRLDDFGVFETRSCVDSSNVRRGEPTGRRAQGARGLRRAAPAAASPVVQCRRCGRSHVRRRRGSAPRVDRVFMRPSAVSGQPGGIPLAMRRPRGRPCEYEWPEAPSHQPAQVRRSPGCRRGRGAGPSRRGSLG